MNRQDYTTDERHPDGKNASAKEVDEDDMELDMDLMEAWKNTEVDEDVLPENALSAGEMI